MSQVLQTAPVLPEGYDWLIYAWPDKWGNEPGNWHAVKISGERRGKSLCGLRSTDWGFDLASDMYCERCLKSVKP